jgi:hypothetical protein
MIEAEDIQSLFQRVGVSSEDIYAMSAQCDGDIDQGCDKRVVGIIRDTEVTDVEGQTRQIRGVAPDDG